MRAQLVHRIGKSNNKLLMLGWVSMKTRETVYKGMGSWRRVGWFTKIIPTHNGQRSFSSRWGGVRGARVVFVSYELVTRVTFFPFVPFVPAANGSLGGALNRKRPLRPTRVQCDRAIGTAGRTGAVYRRFETSEIQNFAKITSGPRNAMSRWLRGGRSGPTKTSKTPIRSGSRKRKTKDHWTPNGRAPPCCQMVGVADRVLGAPGADDRLNMATSRLPFSRPAPRPANPWRQRQRRRCLSIVRPAPDTDAATPAAALCSLHTTTRTRPKAYTHRRSFRSLSFTIVL